MTDADSPSLHIVKVPMHDTGLGQEAGYANDQELIEAHEQWMATLSPENRAIVEAIMQAETRAFVIGTEKD
jgi:hypothetical protein